MILYLLVLAIQVACVVDVIRNRANQLWIMALIFLPGASTIAYVIVEILPRLQGNRHVRAARASIAEAVDPERTLRAAREALTTADTAAARLGVADALAALGRYDEALPFYREAIDRMAGSDPRVEARLARALFETGNCATALEVIERLPLPGTTADRDRLLLLKARILGELGRTADALAIYADIVTRLPGEEARCRYAALLIETGDRAAARDVLEEVEMRMRRLSRGQRAAEASMYKWASDTLRDLRG